MYIVIRVRLERNIPTLLVI